MRFFGYWGILSLIFLCSCASEDPVRSGLPGELDMNKDAGRGQWLFVNLRVAGEELPFCLDTGAPMTSIDKSFESKLGKRIGTQPTRTFEFTNISDIYPTPAFYLGKTLLMKTGTHVAATDLSKCSRESGRPVMGILGIDVLSSYCIQLDFAANKVRFLDDRHLDKRDLGIAFPLKETLSGCYSIAQNLVGAKGPGSLIDLGDNADGWLVPQLYYQWTNQQTMRVEGEAEFPNGILGGKLYTRLVLRDLGTNYTSLAPLTWYNGLGLQFFARNLVTLDFPNQTLYLKQTSVGPFLDRNFQKNAKAEGKSALKFLLDLREQGKLPGWPGWQPARKINVYFLYPDSFTMNFLMDTSEIYHYQIYRPSKDAPWQIHRAWLTDSRGNTLKEFSLNK